MDILDTWLSTPAVFNKLRGYHRFRCGFKVTIKTNGNPFWYGLAAATYVNDDEFNATREFNRVRISQFPHVVFSATTDSEVTIDIPPYNYDYFNTALTGINPKLTMYFHEIVNFQTVGSDGAIADSDISLLVYVQAVNLQISVNTRNGIYTEANDGEDGLISSPALKITKSMDMLKDIPIIGGAAGTIGGMVGKIGAVAKFFGFSKPQQLDATKIVKQTHDIDSTTDTVYNGASVAITIANNTDIDPKNIGLGPLDEMAFRFSNRIWNHYRTITWGLAQSQDATLAIIPVNPCLYLTSTVLSIAGAGHQFTSLGYNCLPFAYWRGSLEYKFTVICSQYHRGKYRIWYQPDQTLGTGLSSQSITMSTYNVLCDVANMQSTIINIPFNDTNGFSVITPQNTADIGVSNLAIPHHGALYVVVQNKLTAPVQVATISILVEVRAGEDFEMVGPTGVEMNKYCADYPVTGTMTNDNANLATAGNFLDVNLADYPTFTEAGEGAQIQLFGDSFGEYDKMLSQKRIGETVLSMRELIKAMQPIRTLSYETPETVTMITALPVHATCIYPGLFYDSSLETNYFTHCSWTFASWYQRLFLYRTGSKRIALSFEGNLSGSKEIKMQAVRYQQTGNVYPDSNSYELVYVTTLDQTNEEQLNRHYWFRNSRGIGGSAFDTNTTYSDKQEHLFTFPTTHALQPAVRIPSCNGDGELNRLPTVVGYVILTNLVKISEQVTIHTGEGDDTSYYGYRGVPMLYKYNQYSNE